MYGSTQRRTLVLLSSNSSQHFTHSPCFICFCGCFHLREINSREAQTTVFAPLYCLTSEATELIPGSGSPRKVCQLPDVANRSWDRLLRTRSSGAPVSFICHPPVGEEWWCRWREASLSGSHRKEFAKDGRWNRQGLVSAEYLLAALRGGDNYHLDSLWSRLQLFSECRRW